MLHFKVILIHLGIRARYVDSSKAIYVVFMQHMPCFFKQKSMSLVGVECFLCIKCILLNLWMMGKLKKKKQKKHVICKICFFFILRQNLFAAKLT